MAFALNQTPELNGLMKIYREINVKYLPQNALD